MTSAESVGRSVLDMLRAGRYQEICELFVPQLRELVLPEMLESAWSGSVAEHGPLVSAGDVVVEPAANGSVEVKIPLAFERGALTLVMSVVGDRLLGSLQLAPAAAAEPVAPWEPPSYVDVDRFSEEEVTFGSGPLAVPGTVSLPREDGPWPGVVLLGGSGPNDRDETFGRNKPLKDVAWGLASRGIAVARFDKVTYAHRDEVARDRSFTLSDEYVPAAVAAVRYLAGVSSVDRVFVLGHSQGGTVAPRVAVAAPEVAGLVIMAGGAEPLHWAAVRQLRYLARLSPGGSEAAIERVAQQARLADGPELSLSTPDSELPFGVPAAYWLDLRGYEPASVAAGLGKPILVLQGGRDYQSTVAEDLAVWREALRGREGVTVRVYEADNHLFFVGSGVSTPAEYEPAQHVDPQVVGDIAQWLLTV